MEEYSYPGSEAHLQVNLRIQAICLNANSHNIMVNIFYSLFLRGYQVINETTQIFVGYWGNFRDNYETGT